MLLANDFSGHSLFSALLYVLTMVNLWHKKAYASSNESVSSLDYTLSSFTMTKTWKMKTSDYSWTWHGYERIYLVADSLLVLPNMMECSLLDCDVQLQLTCKWCSKHSDITLLSLYLCKQPTVYIRQEATWAQVQRRSSYMYNEYCLHFQSSTPLLGLLSSENESNVHRLSQSRSDNLGH